jgi:enoyl-CoA hydratase
LVLDCFPPERLDAEFKAFVYHLAQVPVNQLILNKQIINQQIYSSMNLHHSQLLSVYFDGITRHTKEGHEFQQNAFANGFKKAVHDRDSPFDTNGLPKVQIGLPKL